MKRTLSLMLALTLGLSLALPAGAAEGPVYSDIGTHYAKSAVETWSGYGVLEGYEDGTFRPNRPVTRAEMAAVLDRVMGYGNTVANTYPDVPEEMWYTQSILHLVAEGIFQGREDGMMRPQLPITRQEAFAALARALDMEESTAPTSFTDDWQIADWARGYLSAMKQAGYIRGDQMDRLRPDDPITRAELVVTLDKIAAGFICADGTYSEDCDGNLFINARNVRLKDMTVAGDLMVTDGVGDGDVYLEGVTVEGDIILRGCGENSFHILPGCEITGTIIVTKTTRGAIRLVNESGKAIPMIWVNDGASGVVLDGDELGDVVIACDAPVTIASKKVNTVSVTRDAKVTVEKGTTVAKVEVGKTAKNASLTVAGKVSKLTNDAKITVAKQDGGTVGGSSGGSSGSGSSSSGGGSSSSGSGSSQPTPAPTESPAPTTSPDPTESPAPTEPPAPAEITEVKLQLLAPAFGAIPDDAEEMGPGYTARTQWFNADGSAPSYRWKAADSTEEDTFTADQAYRAVVTLSPMGERKFADTVTVSVTDGNGNDFTPVSSVKSGTDWVVTMEYEKTVRKEFIESVQVSGPSAVALNGTGKLAVSYWDNCLVDPAGHTYQWYQCTDAAGSGKIAIAGATAKEYGMPAADTASEGKLYYCYEVTVQGKTYPSSVITVRIEDVLDLSTVKTPVLPETLGIGQGPDLGVCEYAEVTDLVKHDDLSYYVKVDYEVSAERVDGSVQEISTEKLDYVLYYGGLTVSEDENGKGCGYFRYENDLAMRSNLDDLFAGRNANGELYRTITIKKIKLTVTPHYYGGNESKDLEEHTASKVYDISGNPIIYHFVRSTDDLQSWGQDAKDGYPVKDDEYVYQIGKDEYDSSADAYTVKLVHLNGEPITSDAISPEHFRIAGYGGVLVDNTNWIHPVEFYFNNEVWSGGLYGAHVQELHDIHAYLEYNPTREFDKEMKYEFYFYQIDPGRTAGLSFDNM